MVLKPDLRQTWHLQPSIQGNIIVSLGLTKAWWAQGTCFSKKGHGMYQLCSKSNFIKAKTLDAYADAGFCITKRLWILKVRPPCPNLESATVDVDRNRCLLGKCPEIKSSCRGWEPSKMRMLFFFLDHTGGLQDAPNCTAASKFYFCFDICVWNLTYSTPDTNNRL